MLERMQDSLVQAQDNNKRLSDTLTQLVELNKRSAVTEEPKIKDPWTAAYALNLCTVSVSQIIENNDIRFMEQEYENILNNLNLEMMPKDEELLDILTHILDVINFFKIQANEKALLEKDYQRKLKDAVWSAVPNPSVLISGGGKGGWVGLAVSAAVSVGTGYMNYRKEKAKIFLEQERKEWELERSAMEQLHGLQRQLFETAWKLTEKYGFEDRFRLTERQIKQYNRILNDDNDLRRYERLEYIKDKFDAYPPFWYYIGSAALAVACDKAANLSIKTDYLKRATACFHEYFKRSSSDKKLLREDPIVAQCAFEYIAAINLMQESDTSLKEEQTAQRIYNEKLDMLDSVFDSSHNANDIMQQCAMNYLALGQTDKAVTILKALINEDFNASVNGQFLSMLFINQVLSGKAEAKNDYQFLCEKLPDVVMFPLVSSEIEFIEAEKRFLLGQKISVARRLQYALESYIIKNKREFNEIIDLDLDITEELISFFNRTADALKWLSPKGRDGIIKGIENVFDKGASERARTLRYRSERRDLVYSEFLQIFYKEAVAHKLNELHYVSDMRGLSQYESVILRFYEEQRMILNDTCEEHVIKDDIKSIESAILGEDLSEYKKNKSIYEKYVKIAEADEYKGKLINDVNEVMYITPSSGTKFTDYRYDVISEIKGKDAEIISVIEDQKSYMFKKRDLVFTTKGICVVGKRGIKEEEKYSDLTFSTGCKYLTKSGNENKKVYDQPGVDYKVLYGMITALASVEKSISANNSEVSADIDVKGITDDTIRCWESELIIK